MPTFSAQHRHATYPCSCSCSCRQISIKDATGCHTVQKTVVLGTTELPSFEGVGTTQKGALPLPHLQMCTANSRAQPSTCAPKGRQTHGSILTAPAAIGRRICAGACASELQEGSNCTKTGAATSTSHNNRTASLSTYPPAHLLSQSTLEAHFRANDP